MQGKEGRGGEGSHLRLQSLVAGSIALQQDQRSCPICT